jgi:hypothetical protein
MPAITAPRSAPCGVVGFLLRCTWRHLVQAVLCSGTSSMIPHTQLRAVADALAPSPTWRRREVKAGLAAVDAYLSDAARISGAN